MILRHRIFVNGWLSLIVELTGSGTVAKTLHLLMLQILITLSVMKLKPTFCLSDYNLILERYLMPSVQNFLLICQGWKMWYMNALCGLFQGHLSFSEILHPLTLQWVKSPNSYETIKECVLIIIIMTNPWVWHWFQDPHMDTSPASDILMTARMQNLIFWVLLIMVLETRKSFGVVVACNNFFPSQICMKVPPLC